jgi:hypothetical protein
LPDDGDVSRRLNGSRGGLHLLLYSIRRVGSVATS